MGYKSDKVDSTRMDKAAGEDLKQDGETPSSACMTKNSQSPASVEIETLMVNGKIYCASPSRDMICLVIVVSLNQLSNYLIIIIAITDVLC